MTDPIYKNLARVLAPLAKRMRRDVTARKGANGSYWTAEPLTMAMLEHHCNGGPARGLCPIREGESVTMVACLDFDSHKGEVPWARMVQTVAAVADQLERRGLQPHPFRSSGGNGVHLLLTWASPQDAYSVRCLLSEALAACGLKDGAGGLVKGQVEVFPRQDEVGQGEHGNMFILPMAGHSVPLDPLFGYEPMSKEHALGLEWHDSQPVPQVERPVRAASAASSPPEDLSVVREALFAIPNDPVFGDTPNYFQWRDLCFAVHEATGGSEEGYELFAEWSAQNPAHDEKFTRKRVWDKVKDADRRSSGAITRGTLFHTARQAGWAGGMAPEPDADGFEEVESARALVPVQARGVVGGPAPDDDIFGVPVPAGQGGSHDGPIRVLEGLPPFVRDKKGGVEPTIGNVIMAIRRPDICGISIRHDTFRDSVMCAPAGTEEWRAFGDPDYVWVRERLEQGACGFKPISKELVRDVVGAIADANKFDSAQHWLKGLRHDGTPRVETFLTRYFSCPDTPYTRAVSLYLWTAMAGRVMVPGIKADMAVILVGEQGLRKSTAVAAMVPAKEFFVEISFGEKEEDLARKMRGKLIAEIAELSGLHTRELESIKAFMTRTHEEWVPKFKEFSTQFPRRLVFIGTTNKDEIFADETGERRWLPTRITGNIDIQGIADSCEQLWAEARELFADRGVMWSDAQTLAVKEHSDYKITDPWSEVVSRWLESTDFDDVKHGEKEAITTHEVLVSALGLQPLSITRSHEMRVANVLKGLGRIRKNCWFDGRTRKVWMKPES